MKNGEGSGEFWYAYHVYHSHGITPFKYANMDKEERGMLMAFIDLKIEEDEKQARRNRRK